MELRINHRIDVLDPYSKWLEGIIIGTWIYMRFRGCEYHNKGALQGICDEV